ncbi:MAG: universal stress protein [Nitrososphaeraceae archaeon]|nr:universal stress protein [Nitrososphaeraceae archaeon]
MKEFTKILTPIDGSDNSLSAAIYAIELAIKFLSEIHIISVVPSKIKYGDSSGYFGMVPPKYFDKYRKEAEIWFEQLKNTLKTNQFNLEKITTDVITSPLSVSSTILEYGESKNVDLIVLGTKGKTGLKRLLIGSTAQEIVTYAHCPVMVVR